ncbi:aminotransferase class V-fold PLP-dependent enzyme [Microbacterium sp. PA5]|uniref:aminotransferase class V-fold PLP-dependent enzyme n=1 Tax=Microbacterium sp. PA5 TaxID=3416654 RepID=UPI003CEE5441
MAATASPRSLFGRRPRPAASSARDGFDYLSADDVYLDSACQTLRPRPVIDALTTYYTEYGACGDRVRYAWGRRVEAGVSATRDRVLSVLGLPARRYACAFTLNTTYGLNLLLQQLPAGRYGRIVTTHTEHNAVFVSTMTAARRLGIPRTVVDRGADGAVDLTGHDLTDAVVVLSAMDNVTGTVTADLADLVAEVQRRGGIVIVDAAQAAPHALSRLRGVTADAVCLSAHKMYGPSLGVVAATTDLLMSLDASFLGGGQVSAVTRDDFTLLSEPHTRLEPGLQAWGEVIAFGAALEWLAPRLAAIEESEARLAQRLFDGLARMPHLTLFNTAAAPVISFVPARVGAHRLAVFLSQAGIMVRSGHFCAHHWLADRLGMEPLVRVSLGAHSTAEDVDRALDVTSRMMRGL